MIRLIAKRTIYSESVKLYRAIGAEPCRRSSTPDPDQTAGSGNGRETEHSPGVHGGENPTSDRRTEHRPQVLSPGDLCFPVFWRWFLGMGIRLTTPNESDTLFSNRDLLNLDLKKV